MVRVPGGIPLDAEDEKAPVGMLRAHPAPPAPQLPAPAEIEHNPEANLCQVFTPNWIFIQLRQFNPQIFDVKATFGIWNIFYNPPYNIRFAGDLWPVLTIDAVDQLVVDQYVTDAVKGELKRCLALLQSCVLQSCV